MCFGQYTPSLRISANEPSFQVPAITRMQSLIGTISGLEKPVHLLGQCSLVRTVQPKAAQEVLVNLEI